MRLAWLLAQRPWIVTIPGHQAASPGGENLAAADLALTAGELDLVNEVSAKIDIQSGRYPEFLEAQTNL